MTENSPEAAWVPDTCTLPTAQQPLRVAEFDHLFRTAVRATQRRSPGRLRLFVDGAAEAEVRDLVRRETECCSFFTFDITRDTDQLQVDVTVPDEHVAVLDALERRRS